MFVPSIENPPPDGATDQRNDSTISSPTKEELNGKQGKCGLDWFTEGRQGHHFHGDRRAEKRQLLVRNAVWGGYIGHHAGGTDRRRPRKLLLHGAGRATGWIGPDTGKD